jgi:hypothetical protein
MKSVDHVGGQVKSGRIPVASPVETLAGGQEQFSTYSARMRFTRESFPVRRARCVAAMERDEKKTRVLGVMGLAA